MDATESDEANTQTPKTTTAKNMRIQMWLEFVLIILKETWILIWNIISVQINPYVDFYAYLRDSSTPCMWSPRTLKTVLIKIYNYFHLLIYPTVSGPSSETKIRTKKLAKSARSKHKFWSTVNYWEQRLKEEREQEYEEEVITSHSFNALTESRQPLKHRNLAALQSSGMTRSSLKASKQHGRYNTWSQSIIAHPVNDEKTIKQQLYKELQQKIAQRQKRIQENSVLSDHNTGNVVQTYCEKMVTKNYSIHRNIQEAQNKLELFLAGRSKRKNTVPGRLHQQTKPQAHENENSTFRNKGDEDENRMDAKIMDTNSNILQPTVNTEAVGEEHAEMTTITVPAVTPGTTQTTAPEASVATTALAAETVAGNKEASSAMTSNLDNKTLNNNIMPSGCGKKPFSRNGGLAAWGGGDNATAETILRPESRSNHVITNNVSDSLIHSKSERNFQPQQRKPSITLICDKTNNKKCSIPCSADNLTLRPLGGKLSHKLIRTGQIMKPDMKKINIHIR